MVREDESICPFCGGELKHYDTVRRVVKSKYGIKSYIYIERVRCIDCHSNHRVIPDYIFPYKQYEAEIIIGFTEGLLSSYVKGFEDYPCEMTIHRWLRTRKLHTL